MKAYTHKQLAKYFIKNYFQALPKLYSKAFLIGCIEPDRNISTYLKGSIKYQWLRGHNWTNTKKYILRLAQRLEHKKHMKLMDYFLLGRLTHYLADAFTFAHNAQFGHDLRIHRAYENALMIHMDTRLRMHHKIPMTNSIPLETYINVCHDHYISKPKSAQGDSEYILQICTFTLCRILAVPPIRRSKFF